MMLRHVYTHTYRQATMQSAGLEEFGVWCLAQGHLTYMSRRSYGSINTKLPEIAEVSKMSHYWFLPVSWLLAIGADGCLVVMADTHLVRWAAHLQTGILGDVWTYGGEIMDKLIL